MSLATFAIGLLPGYGQIGLWAPALLVFLKLLQAFSASGEYTGGATFLSEYAPDRRRGFYVGFMGSSYLGFAFGAGLVAVLQVTLGDDAMQSFGWRSIPYCRPARCDRPLFPLSDRGVACVFRCFEGTGKGNPNRRTQSKFGCSWRYSDSGTLHAAGHGNRGRQQRNRIHNDVLHAYLFESDAGIPGSPRNPRDLSIVHSGRICNTIFLHHFRTGSAGSVSCLSAQRWESFSRYQPS